MVTDIGIVAVALISSAAMMLTIFLMSYNYKSKKLFNYNLSLQRKQDKLKLDKLRKELKVQDQPKQDPDQSQDLNKIIGNIAQKYINPDEDYEDEGEDDITSTILQYAKDNPELTNMFLSKLNLGGSKKESTDQYLGD